jgi:hypothetical protein
MKALKREEIYANDYRDLELWLALGSLLRIFRDRQDLIFENFVLRRQLT